MSISRESYRNILPISLIFLLTTLASIGIYIYYAAKWSEESENGFNILLDGVLETKMEIAYNGAVISMLLMIVFFNGFHLSI